MMFVGYESDTSRSFDTEMSFSKKGTSRTLSKKN